MTFTTLPRSRGTSDAARRIQRAAEAHARSKHGTKAALTTSRSLPKGARAIIAIRLPATITPNDIAPPMPAVRLVDPRDLVVELAYQRDLSDKSHGLIRRIVANWNWARFKPPICADSDGSLFVIDGQHTAIAAATHPKITKIPILVVKASAIEGRAACFVAHNRDRISLSPFQIFHAETASGDKDARAILKIVIDCGASIPRSPLTKGYAKPGQLVSVNETRKIYTNHGGDVLRRVVTLAVKAGLAPIGVTITRALRMILTESHFEDVARLSDGALVSAIKAVGDIEPAAVAHGRKIGEGRHRACALLIAGAIGVWS